MAGPSAAAEAAYARAALTARGLHRNSELNITLRHPEGRLDQVMLAEHKPDPPNCRVISTVNIAVLYLGSC